MIQKFTEIYYDDAERFAVYLASVKNEEIEIVYDDAEGFPMPAKNMQFGEKVNCFKVGNIEIAYLTKRKSPDEDKKHRNRSLYRYALGQMLKDARERMGITLEQLADTTGLKASNLRNIELGRYNVDIDVLGLIMDGIGCRLSVEFD